MKTDNERYWICVVCGKKYGTPKTITSTWHQGTCDYCDEETAVTSNRDYGYCKKVENENDKSK